MLGTQAMEMITKGFANRWVLGRVCYNRDRLDLVFKDTRFNMDGNVALFYLIFVGFFNPIFMINNHPAKSC